MLLGRFGQFMKSTKLKFTVAIVGGGIGGVTLAVALSRQPDIEFDLYESAAGFEEIGAGVGIFARSVDALEALGITDYEKILTPHARSDGSWDYRKADVNPGVHLAKRYYPVIRGASGNYRRSDFLNLLVSHLPQDIQEKRVHFKKRLLRYEQDDDKVTLHFTDSTTAVCSVLIGCDGIKSATRYTMYEDLASAAPGEDEKAKLLNFAVPRWSGMVAYRGLIKAELVEAELGHPHRCVKQCTMFLGKRAHLVVFPVANGRFINVVAFVSRTASLDPQPSDVSNPPSWPPDRLWVESCSQEEMLQAYEGFEDDAQVLLKFMTSPSRWAIHELNPLPFYAHKRVALLGDAAHATQPHQGQGANQSIEDAYVLSLILGSPSVTESNLQAALKAYESVRLPRANKVISMSNETGKIHQFSHSPEYEAVDVLTQWITGDYTHWLFLGSAKEETEHALKEMSSID